MSGNAHARFCRRGSRGDPPPQATYLHSYGSPREARAGLTRYLEFYNHGRLHQALDYRTPAELYFGTHFAPPTTDHKREEQEDQCDSTTIKKGEASTLDLPTFLS